MEDNKECKPEETEREDKFHSADINCFNCAQTDCAYWIIYNSKKVE